MARSLMDGIEKTPAAVPGKREGKGGDGGKLVFACALLLIAAGVFAWSQGWILGGDKMPKQSPEQAAQQKQEFEVQQKHMEEQIKSGKAKIGGSS